MGRRFFVLLGMLLLVVSLYGKYGFGAREQKEFSKLSTDNLLALSWQNAFCETHRKKRECRQLEKSSYATSHFTLHGLWPQPRSRVNCRGAKKVRLPNDLYRELKEVMPAVKSGLQNHEWKKHGTCYGKAPKEYFKDALALTKQVNESKVRDFFARNVGKRVSREQVAKLFNDAFGKGSGRKVKMVCKNGMITELWINLKGKITPKTDIKELLKGAKNVHGGCKKGLIDGFGYRR